MIINIYSLIKRYLPLQFKIKTKAFLYDLLFYKRALILYKYKITKKRQIKSSRTIPLRILLVMPHLIFGGVERLTYDMIKNMDKKKYIFYIACTLKKGGLYESFSKLVNRRTYDLSLIGKNYWKQRRYIEELIIENNIDIIILSNNEPYYFMLPFFSLLPKRPIIFNWLHCDTFYFQVHELGYEKFFPFIDKTIVNNKGLRKFLVTNKNYSTKKITLISNGVDLRQFDPKKYPKTKIKERLGIPSSQKVIGFIARLTSEKQPLEFIKLAKKISSIDENVCFIVVGEGYYKSSMLQLAKKLNLEKNIYFLGKRTDIPEILSVVNIIVSTSISEGFGLAIAEAIAMEIPAVAFRVGGISELVQHKKNGFLVNPNNISDMAKYVIKLINNDSLRKNMGENGRRIIERKFNISFSCQKLSSLINKHV